MFDTLIDYQHQYADCCRTLSISYGLAVQPKPLVRVSIAKVESDTWLPLTIAGLSECHCLRSLSLGPASATDTDGAFTLAWRNIEDLDLLGWQQSNSHCVTLEGRPRLWSPTRQIDPRIVWTRFGKTNVDASEASYLYLSRRGQVAGASGIFWHLSRTAILQSHCCRLGWLCRVLWIMHGGRKPS
ncbi:hypothetical protein EDD15DRAFT_1469815 [Pisolithus albus]|nr:hypothetical protein EDD15DRAFT_1469815 [Pisolithus albus]